MLAEGFAGGIRADVRSPDEEEQGEDAAVVVTSAPCGTTISNDIQKRHRNTNVQNSEHGNRGIAKRLWVTGPHHHLPN